MIEQQTSREHFKLNAGSQEENHAKLIGALAQFDVDFDPNMSFEQNNATFRLLQKFSKYGVIEKQNGHFVWDIEKVKNFPYGHSHIAAGGKTVTLAEVRLILSSKSGYSKADVDAAEGNFSKLEKRPLLELPKDSKSIVSSGKSGWPEASSRALIQPWELGKQNYDWTQPIILESGETTNLAELAVAYKLQHDLHARKNDKGELEITPDPDKLPYRKFSSRLFNKFVKLNPTCRGSDGRMISFENSPVEFTYDHMPNLVHLGLLNEQKDFRRIGGRIVEDRFRPHPRRLNPKAPYIHFSNSKHPFAKYYIGRHKIVGLEIPIDPKTMEAQLLDQDTVGILQKDKEGHRKILCVFDLLSKEEIDTLYEEEEQRLIKKFGQASQTRIAQGVNISGKIIKERMRSYDASEFLPPRPDEKPADYFRRIRPLDDAEFVLNQVHGFFLKSGVGVQNLPWAEQLLLSRALLESADEQKLLEFAKTHGIAGVRSFLSLDYDKKLGGKILNIGERLGSGLAKEVFKKYGEIVDAASQAQNYLENHLPDRSASADDIAKVRERLLKKGKDLLLQTAKNLEQTRGQLEAVQVLEQLDSLKTEVLLFAAMFKEKKLNFLNYSGVNKEDRDSGSLKPEEKDELLKIFLANRIGFYPEELRKRVIEDFKKTLDSVGHTFRLLKHDDKIVAFFHYDKVDDETFYVGSLNLHPSAQDTQIAIKMLDEALEENANKKITAVVWAENPIKLFYTGRLHFSVVGEIANYHDTGQTYLLLERAKQGAAVQELKKAA